MSEECMGRSDSRVTPDQAAKILGVGRHQVYRYQREGLLTAYKGEGKFRLLLDAHEVSALAAIRHSPTTVLELQKTLVATQVHCRALERRLDLVERALCVRNPNLCYERASVEELVSRAYAAVKDPPTDALQILDWCNVFFSVKEEFLKLVQLYTENPEPWSPFLRLAERIDTYRPSTLNDEDVLGAYMLLTAARRALRQTVFFYLMEYRTPAYAQEVIPEAATTLVRRLNAKL